MPETKAATLRLWRENRTDQPWEISDADLIARFSKWPGLGPGRSRRELVEWRGNEWALSMFVGDPSGLNSVWERADWLAMIDRVWSELRAATVVER